METSLRISETHRKYGTQAVTARRLKLHGIKSTGFEQEHPPWGLINSHISAFAQVFIRHQHQVKLHL